MVRVSDEKAVAAPSGRVHHLCRLPPASARLAPMPRVLKQVVAPDSDAVLLGAANHEITTNRTSRTEATGCTPRRF
jgi:hypothetical protein